MKKYILLFYVFFLSINIYSQAPQGFNYQAIVRDASGNIKANTGVQFTFKIETANGVPLYSELHTTITNKYGLTNMTIGKGISNDDFSNIKWGSGTYMLNVNIDGVDVGTTQLMSVPYALYAVSSGSSSGGGGGVGISSTVDNGDGTFTLNYTDGTSFTTTNLSGKSAYQLWIDQGNTGTEEDFLGSLEPVTLENTKFLSLNGQEIVGKTVPIIAGGTGGITASAARSNLGVDPAGTDNSTNVTLGGSSTYLTISDQQIIRGKVNLSNSVMGTLPISNGGTGGTTAEEARTALGLEGLEGSDPVTLENTNYLSLNGQEIKGNTIPIIAGGTGAVNATAARSNLGVDVAGTDNSTEVTLGGTSNYLTISGQQIIRGKVNLSNSVTGTLPISQGGTGGTTAEEAKTALGLESATPITLENTNYLSLNGQEIKGNTIPIIAGGTGAVNATAARSNLGVDVAGTDNSTEVTLGGTSNYLTISGQQIIRGKVDLSNSVTGTLPISQGGTGAVTAEAARVALGVDGIQTNVSTNLTFDRDATTLTVKSSDGDDAILPVANTDKAGVMSAALFDDIATNKTKTGISPAQASAITANTAKETNVSTNLTFDRDATTLTVKSSDGDDAILPVANTDKAGVMSAALFDEVAANTSKSGISPAQVNAITANTAKETNVSTNLTFDRDATTLTVKSSDGDDAILPVANTDKAGVMSAALFDEVAANTSKSGISPAQVNAITANTAKETNVSTNLTFDRDATTLTVKSSDGDDAILPVANTDKAGVMSAALFDDIATNKTKTGISPAQVNAITANTAKETNVSTNLTFDRDATTLTVKSSDGDDAILPVANTDKAGVMSAALFDEVAANTSKSGISPAQVNAITANTAKETNVSTNLTFDRDATTLTVKSSDGDDAILPVANTDKAGVMSAALFDDIATNKTKTGISSAQVTTIANLGTISTQDANAVNIDGGAIDGVTIGTDGVVTQAVIDNINIDGATIGHTGDTDLLTLASGIVTVAGEVDAATLDISGNGDIDGTLTVASGAIISSPNANSVYIGKAVTNTAQYNTGIGKNIFNSLNGGTDNAAIGYDGLAALTSGQKNVGAGSNALKSVNTGQGNIGIGYFAGGDFNSGDGTALTTGSDNTIIGYDADVSASDASNQIVIGYQATGQADNSVTLGNASVTKVYAAQDGEATIYASALTRAASSSGDDLSVSLTGAVDASILISSAGTGSDAISIDATAGSMVIAPTLADGKSLKLGKNGAVEAIFSPHGTAANEKFSLTNTAGTATDAIALTSTAGGITLASSAGVDITGSTGLILENDETITNSTDGTVSIGGNLSGTGSISGFDANLNELTGTTYTLAASDNGKVVALNNSSAITLTVPTSLGDGFNCLIVQKGAGQVTIVGATGVVLKNGSDQYKTYAQYSIITVLNIGAISGSDLYIISGDTGS